MRLTTIFSNFSFFFRVSRAVLFRNELRRCCAALFPQRYATAARVFSPHRLGCCAALFPPASYNRGARLFAPRRLSTIAEPVTTVGGFIFVLPPRRF